MTDGVDNKNKDVVLPSMSAFITEDDVFDIAVEFYKEKGRVFVKDIDDNFDVNKQIEKFAVTVKYPSQGDMELIQTMAGRQINTNNPSEISMPDFLRLEVSRLSILMRKWSAGVEITPDKIYQLNPKIVKGLILKIRNEIGLEGII